jgi:hypothetical protein
MKLTQILCFLQIFTMSAYANDLVVAPPNATSSGCDLAVAGFSSKEPFLKFFDQLLKSAAINDKIQLSDLILYPLQINAKKKYQIHTQVEFQKKFQDVFTLKIQNVVKKQKLDQLFCRDQGVMFGDGELWVGTDGKKIGIKTINFP